MKLAPLLCRSIPQWSKLVLWPIKWSYLLMQSFIIYFMFLFSNLPWSFWEVANVSLIAEMDDSSFYPKVSIAVLAIRNHHGYTHGWFNGVGGLQHWQPGSMLVLLATWEYARTIRKCLPYFLEDNDILVGEPWYKELILGIQWRVFWKSSSQLVMLFFFRRLLTCISVSGVVESLLWLSWRMNGGKKKHPWKLNLKFSFSCVDSTILEIVLELIHILKLREISSVLFDFLIELASILGINMVQKKTNQSQSSDPNPFEEAAVRGVQWHHSSNWTTRAAMCH